MYVPHKHVACLHNHCCRGKAASNIMRARARVCVFLPPLSSKQIAPFQGPYFTDICGLPGSTILFHVISQMA